MIGFASREQFDLLLRELGGDYDVYGPGTRDGSPVLTRLSRISGTDAFCWNDYRLADSLKAFWFQPAKLLAGWRREAPADMLRPSLRPKVIVGAKACDLNALEVLDRVFRDHAYREPAYCAAREENLIISGDCTGHGSSCFCTLLDRLPWASSSFDLNLSPVEDGYLLETGSARGKDLMAEHARLFREARGDEIAARDRSRKAIAASVREQNRQFEVKDSFADAVLKNLKTRIWGELAASCVECNACNYICPTCHCFLLHDCKAGQSAVRVSLWDSCFHGGYARMAGGGTPRLQLTERFKNHYYHKFVSFPENWGIVGCSGCGRCVDACLGGIDKRECLHQLESRWIPSEVVEGI